MFCYNSQRRDDYGPPEEVPEEAGKVRGSLGGDMVEVDGVSNDMDQSPHKGPVSDHTMQIDHLVKRKDSMQVC